MSSNKMVEAFWKTVDENWGEIKEKMMDALPWDSHCFRDFDADQWVSGVRPLSEEIVCLWRDRDIRLLEYLLLVNERDVKERSDGTREVCLKVGSQITLGQSTG